jgi:hypothetical protein
MLCEQKKNPRNKMPKVEVVMGHAGEVFFKIGMLWQSPDDGHTKEDSQKFARYGKGRRVG